LEERLQLAVFIDFDNIEIGVKSTLNAELDLSLVLEALKERGEVISKSAYGDWARAGMHSRTLTDHAVHMVQRNVTPRGDKNGADINLVVDALEMAFTRPHINGFAIVGGDSDFIALVEKLKQFGKRVFVVGGRSFTSGILQRNCHEFISYENLLSASRGGGRGAQQQSRGPASARLTLQQGLAKVQRALKILADRGVEPQLGPLKSTLLQLDSTFSERDYGASSFREFIQRLDDKHLLKLRRIDQGYLVEMNGDGSGEVDAQASAARPQAEAQTDGSSPAPTPSHPTGETAEAPAPHVEREAEGARSEKEALALLRAAVDRIADSRPGKPLYVRHLAQGMRAIDPGFDEQSYGFRTLTELMYLGQREGILRMQRDRQGAWRIQPLGASAEASVASSEARSAASGPPEAADEVDAPVQAAEGEADVEQEPEGEEVAAAPAERFSEAAPQETEETEEEPVAGDRPVEGEASTTPAEAAEPAQSKAKPAARSRRRSSQGAKGGEKAPRRGERSTAGRPRATGSRAKGTRSRQAKGTAGDAGGAPTPEG
jgi:uncharacterized protein (TIGR00288 family)